MSSLDKTIANCFYEIEVDPATEMPVTIKMLLLTGTKGGTEAKGKQIVGGKHVAFHFEYRLSDFGKVERIKIPPEAERLLAQR